jgi:cysteine desulfurase family protein (TIGR01976 family)
MPAAVPTVEEIRARFPALRTPWALLENAGGSQVPREVADAIRAHMLKRYVQLGAGYPMSVAATETVDRAHAFIEELMGGAGAGRAILGPSTTQLCHMLAGCIAKTIRPGDEIVLAETAHEANAGPWLALERCGATIRWWRCDRDAMELTLDGLDAVLSPRTRIVAFPHVSNLLGGILDVAEITRRAHAAGARVVVDGVAFAPHRLMSVAAWDVDWYVYSTYKVFGPHMAALHGRHDAIAELEGPNHFFIPRDKVPYVFELGGASHEGCAGLLALARYLAWLGDGRDAETIDRAGIERAFARIVELELPLQRRLVEGLADAPSLRLVGSRATGVDQRVPTASVLPHGERPSELVARAHANGVAIRFGHMYAYRLCEALGIAVDEGVVRVSAVHYNTVDEIDRAISILGGR